MVDERVGRVYYGLAGLTILRNYRRFFDWVISLSRQRRVAPRVSLRRDGWGGVRARKHESNVYSG